MDFLKKRIKQYQKKKLDDALSKIKFHSNMKIQLEQKIKTNVEYDQINLKKEITFHNNMIKIWENNTKKIKKEMEKIDD